MAAKQKVYKIYSCFLDGITGILAEIEVSITPGIPTFDIIGLCDSSIRESRGRIQAALRVSGYTLPKGHITVSISPAYLRKSGSNMDLAIALGILLASGQVFYTDEGLIYAEGELSLIGELKATPGAALRLSALKENSKFKEFRRIIIPSAEITAAEVNNMTLLRAGNIKEACDGLFNYAPTLYEMNVPEQIPLSEMFLLDSLKGQEKAKRALIISAAGFHNILLLGSPGSGKTMAGRLINDLMPQLTPYEAGQAYAIRDANRSVDSEKFDYRRPFRYISSNITSVGLFGKSTNLTPGELSMANNGIAFADEILEFPAYILDSLREPMEDHEIRLIKDNKTYVYPADFLFVGAGNPCKCGYYLDDSRRCKCTPMGRKRYLSKLSGPFMDRIDLFAELRSLNRNDMEELLMGDDFGIRIENQKRYRQMVSQAWAMQEERYGFDGKKREFNSTFNKVNDDLFRCSKEVINYASEISEKNGLTGRGFSKLMRVGRTIADIEGCIDMNKNHISEAAIFKTGNIE